MANDENNFHGAFTLAKFCRAYSIGLTSTYQQIKDGKLRAVKCGNKTLILHRDAEAWAESLPTMSTAL